MSTKNLIPDLTSLAGESPAVIKMFAALKEQVEILTGRGKEDDKALVVGDLKKIGIEKNALKTSGNSYNFEAHKV